MSSNSVAFKDTMAIHYKDIATAIEHVALLGQENHKSLQEEVKTLKDTLNKLVKIVKGVAEAVDR